MTKKITIVCAAMLLFCVAAGVFKPWGSNPVVDTARAADLSAADRAARCENNKARINLLAMQMHADPDIATDEEIARMRTALNAADRDYAIIMRIDADRKTYGNRDDAIFSRVYGSARNLARDMHLGSMESCSPDLVFNESAQVRVIDCVNEVRSHLAKHIDTAENAKRRRDAMTDEIARMRSRTDELQCSSLAAGSDNSNSTGTCKDIVVGSWDWAFAPRGQTPVGHGSVDFKPDGHMDWSGGSHGIWSCAGTSVSLTWQDKPNTDTMLLSGDERTMSGTNNDGWNVRGTR